jgi:hypothetical protein
MRLCSERWLVFGSGERCRVSLWPQLPAAGATAPPAVTHRQRYLVFESPDELGCVPVAPAVKLDQFSPEDLWRLYKRAHWLARACMPESVN